MSRLLSIFIALLIINNVSGSGYPANYGHQKVKIWNQGPIVIMRVASGVMPAKYVFGYKKNSILGNNAKKLNFVMSASMKDIENGDIHLAEREIVLSWKGSGYDSEETLASSFSDVIAFHTIRSFRIAVRDKDDNWDNNGGMGIDYIINLNQEVETIDTGMESNFNNTINDAAWGLFLKAMN